MDIKALETIAWAPYETIKNPTQEDWQKSYDALKQLAAKNPKEGSYPNTLGYLCYYGRHTGERNYEEARQWFEKGAKLKMIESTYKLADMLMNGQGGPKDEKRALRYYVFLYYYCQDEFESGKYESKFADLALRLGRLHHEGSAVYQDDMEALGYLLEAQYALNERKPFDHYGDQTVAKNIQSLIDACAQPDEELQSAHYYGVGLGRIPKWFINPDHHMIFSIQTAEDGTARLEFRRRNPEGKKPNKVLWSVAPAMKCFMTDFVVLYAKNIRLIWNIHPGKAVECDRYEYDEKSNMHLFYLDDEIQCRLMGGEYVLAMDEFFYTGIKDSLTCSDEAGLQ